MISFFVFDEFECDFPFTIWFCNISNVKNFACGRLILAARFAGLPKLGIPQTGDTPPKFWKTGDTPLKPGIPLPQKKIGAFGAVFAIIDCF